MSASAISDHAQVEATYQRAEYLVREAAEAERAAFVRWQQAYGAYEAARDQASAAWTAWAGAVVS
jgi:hypothetical protein